MLNLEQISAQFPDHLQQFKRNMLREYLQYKILKSIFDSEYASKLSFLGGTALRIIHNNTRFSEDLDFDDLGITAEKFSALSKIVKKDLEAEGLEVEIREVLKNAFRCYLKIPKILYQENLSGLPEEKILIQLDTVPHNFDYTPEQKLLNKFDVFTQINVTPADILLSQKIYAATNRKRAKGRDFYDIVFILSLGIKPNYSYLQKNIQTGNAEELKAYLSQVTAAFDFQDLANDVEPFLFSSKEKKRVELFREYIAQADL